MNCLSTSVLENVFPFETLFKIKPNYTRFKVFGCLCYPWIRPYTSHKIGQKSVPCVFLGYLKSQSAYLCLDLASNKTYVSRHVLFDECQFTFKNKSHTQTKPNSIPPTAHDLFSTPSTKSIQHMHNFSSPTETSFIVSSPKLNTIGHAAQSSPIEVYSNSIIDALYHLGLGSLPQELPPIEASLQQATEVSSFDTSHTSSSHLPTINTHPMQTRSKHGIYNPSTLQP